PSALSSSPRHALTPPRFPYTTLFRSNTGTPLAGRPSLGAWVSYGLGTENQNLPAFVVIEDNKGQVVNGPRNWGSGFMPAVYQGRSEEHTSELQSRFDLVCRLLLEKKK